MVEELHIWMHFTVTKNKMKFSLLKTPHLDVLITNTQRGCIMQEGYETTSSERPEQMEFSDNKGEVHIGGHTDSHHDKQKLYTVTDAVPIRQVMPQDYHDEEDILFWSGPPKTPRSPMTYSGNLNVTEPEYHEPRRRTHTKSTSASGAAGQKPQHDGMIGQKRSRCGDHTRGGKQHKSTTMRQSSSGRDEVQVEGAATQDADNATRIESNHMPTRDPLCHTSNVTPPCPIKTGQTQTPALEQTFTHVSILTDQKNKVHYCVLLEVHLCYPGS